jgi:hypothetical protein
MSEDVPGRADRAAPTRQPPGSASGVSPWAASPSNTEPPRGAARLLNALTVLALAAAAFTVLLTATPALVRAALSREKAADVARGAQRFSPHRVKLPGGHPRFALPGDDASDEERVPTDDLERLYPGALPAQPSLTPHEDPYPRAEQGDREPGGRGSIRMGLARQTLKLYDKPRDTGIVLGEIKAGEQVVILREDGPWALIVHSGSMGWTRKSEIAVR